ncbi:phage head-tail connector protein [uncultured Streptococcus sp.]|uniref:phage head-tail connector protein n=1 Tax=Streptococcus constellatus TaxID=76860 RepID=UPI0035A69F19
MMNEEVILELLKLQLGISTSIRDEILKSKIKSAISELKNVQGLKLNPERSDHVDFVVDYAAYRYKSGEVGNMPRHLQWRLHNLIMGGAQ